MVDNGYPETERNTVRSSSVPVSGSPTINERSPEALSGGNRIIPVDVSASQSCMGTRLIIDKAGGVVIPKTLRQELHMEPGDALEMDSTGEQITLRPVRGIHPLTKEHGVWVFHAGQPLPASATDDMLDLTRKERDLANLGACTGFLRRSRSPQTHK